MTLQRLFAQYLLLLIFMASGTRIVALEPSFGIVTIIQVPNEFLAITKLSEQGRYIVGVSQTAEDTEYGLQFTLASLLVWDIGTFNFETDLISPVATESVAISQEAIGHPTYGISIAPNEEFVAVYINTSIQVFTLPDLNLYKTMRFSIDDYQQRISEVAWSPDSHMLMVIQGANEFFTVWDILLNETYIYETEYIRPSERRFESIRTVVEATNNGWLISGFDDQVPAFVFCDRQLEECVSYLFEHSSFMFVLNSLDGQTILTIELNTNAGIWEYQLSGSYELVDVVHECVEDISPSGSYLYVRCRLTQGNEQIIDLETASIIHTFESSEVYQLDIGASPIWFPNEEYLLVAIRHPIALQIYQSGNPQPIDEIIFPNSSQYKETGIRFAADSISPSISENGQYVLTNLGGIAYLANIIIQ